MQCIVATLKVAIKRGDEDLSCMNLTHAIALNM